MTVQKQAACPVCGLRTAHKSFDDGFFYCRDCELHFTQNVPVAADYDAAYYERGGGMLQKIASVFWESALTKIAGRLRRATSTGPKTRMKVLDVGCGAGQLAGGLSRRGFASAGIDTSKAAIAAAKKKFPGVNFKVGRLGGAVFPPASFDAVTLFHVLEHVPKPLPFLRAIRQVLKPKGIFLLRVPNIASFEARLAGKKWFHFDYPWHVVHYSPKALTEVLRRAGFSSVSMNHNPGEYKQSLLYAVFAFLGMKNIPVALRVASLPLQIFFAPLSWILGLAGSGATIEAQARK